MGTYNINITAAGGHGCSREVKDSERVFGCQKMACVDCEIRRFIALLRSQGSSIDSAILTHWPGQPSEVRDDLLTGIRTGNF